MARLLLITGGARSGKSRYAQDRVQRLERDFGGGRIAFLATAQASDSEMTARIGKHRAERPDRWETFEAPLDCAARMADLTRRFDVVLMDCLTLYVSNLMLSAMDPGTGEMDSDRAEKEIEHAVEGLCEAALRGSAAVVMVTNEVGMGIVPDYPLGRWFRDVAGRANQQAAAAADEVVLMVCGLPVRVKG